MKIEEFRNDIYIILPTFFAAIFIACVLVFDVRYRPKHEIAVLDSHWDITYADNTWQDHTLTELVQLLPDTLRKNEIIRIERTLDMAEVPSPTIALTVFHLAVEVWLDDTLLDSFGMDAYAANRFIGGNLYMVNLPDNYSGKRLAINYYTAEDNITPYIYSMRLGAFHDLVWTFLSEYDYVLVIGVFLCLFGGFFLMFSLFFSVLLPEIRGQGISSVLCILIGIWILAHYRVLAMFTGGRYTMTVEYLTFYLILPLLYFLIMQVTTTGHAFRVLAYVNTLAVALSFFLHFTGIFHMHRFRGIYFAMDSLFLFILIALEIRLLRNGTHDPVRFLQLSGPTVFCVMIFIAMIIYLLSGSEASEYRDFSVVLLTTGPLVFAMTRFIIYVRLLAEMTPQRLEFSSLNAMAYVDALTGLSNRTLMSELREELDDSNDDYCIISLDLNDLKLVNDTRGHTMGDRLLKDFASLIRTVFPDDVQAMRVGGDEFLLLWKEVTPNRVRERLTALETAFRALDESDPDVPHSFAYGFAFNTEAGLGDAHSIYLEADKRMYARKQEMKGRR